MLSPCPRGRDISRSVAGSCEPVPHPLSIQLSPRLLWGQSKQHEQQHPNRPDQ